MSITVKASEETELTKSVSMGFCGQGKYLELIQAIN